MKKNLLIFIILLFPFYLSSQEVLKSNEEEYYDFLSLQGLVERPTLGYRTLSDSVWELPENAEHIWKNNNLGTKWTFLDKNSPNDNWFLRGIDKSIKLKLYGPEWFNSYNTAAPYGQNDGALWQGRGYNTSLTSGVRLEAYGFEVTFKPQLSFSQNKDFSFLPGISGNQFSYFWGPIDFVQRYGDKYFFNYDFGDTEIRWNFYNFTVGFGFQSPWLGPTKINSMLGSNNAPTYPKFDFGFRKTKLYFPFTNFFIGTIETRIWIGQLTESNYFINDNKIVKNLIDGFNISFIPAFLPNLTIGATKVCITKWGNNFWKYINPFYSSNDVSGVGEDQKASLYLDYYVQKFKFNIYAEFGIDDYTQNKFFGFLKYPFDTLIFSFGFIKQFQIKNDYICEILFEISDFSEPRNRLRTSYSFNMHSQIIEGYTNKGQCLGSNLGVGGNSQLLKLSLYYPKGMTSIFFQRENPDNTYSFINLSNNNETYKAYLNTGVSSSYFINNYFNISFGADLNYIINSLYYTYDNEGKIIGTEDIPNFSLFFNIKILF